MPTADIEITETGNGGDFIVSGNLMSVVLGWENMPYLGMFGGNVEQSTPIVRNEGEQAFDYWANELLFEEKEQFNSSTERKLTQVPLNSSGRLQIEQAISKDLDFMRAFAELTISTEIIAPDNLRISIKVQEPDNLQQNEFVYIWDAVENKLTSINIEQSQGGDFNNDFNNDFN